MKNRIETINQNLDGKTFNYQGILDKEIIVHCFNCDHEWPQGKEWNQYCPKCGSQNICDKEDVEEELNPIT